jgi:hypothetical protein
MKQLNFKLSQIKIYSFREKPYQLIDDSKHAI